MSYPCNVNSLMYQLLLETMQNNVSSAFELMPLANPQMPVPHLLFGLNYNYQSTNQFDLTTGSKQQSQAILVSEENIKIPLSCKKQNRLPLDPRIVFLSKKIRKSDPREELREKLRLLALRDKASETPTPTFTCPFRNCHKQYK